jgi:hypothetical protein
VSARDELSLWRANVLLRKYSLDFVFALQIAPDASAVVTRGHLADGTVAYSLLDAATFETRQAFLRAESYGHPFYFGVFRDSLMFKEMDGLHQVNWDGRDRLFCSEPICRDSCGAFAVLQGTAAQQRVAVSSCYGLGVAAVDGGLLWSKTIKQDLGLGHMMFLGVAASSDGRRIVLDVMRGGRGHQDFDGLHLDYDMELLVYDASTGKRLSALPFGSANGDGEFTFSQDGKTLWTFDGKFLRGYSLPE